MVDLRDGRGDQLNPNPKDHRDGKDQKANERTKKMTKLNQKTQGFP